MVVLNSRIDPKNGTQNFGISKIHLRVGFTQKNRPKYIGITIITLKHSEKSNISSGI